VGGTRPLFVREVREAHPDKEVEVWLQDEARLGQQGTLTTVWARRGSRPRSVKQTEYQWVYLSAAVNAETGQALGMITPDMNTLVMNDLLSNLSRLLGEDRHAVLVWDNAGFHTDRKYRVRVCRSPVREHRVGVCPRYPTISDPELALRARHRAHEINTIRIIHLDRLTYRRTLRFFRSRRTRLS